MKKLYLYVLLGCVAVSLSLIGCGGDSTSSSGQTSFPPVTVDPSATVFPFGLESMRVPNGDEVNAIEFTYDDATGLVVAVTMTTEEDSNSDGRTDGIETIVYTLDPTITVTEVTELEDVSYSLSALEAIGALRAGPSFAMATTLGDLPGAVIEVSSQYYSYGSGLRAVNVPEEMVLTQQTTLTYTYDDTGRMLTASSVEEDYNSIDYYTITCSYDNAGNVTQIKSTYKYDLYKDGWIDENSVVENNYTYDDNGNLIKKEEDDYTSSYLETTSYTYDDAGNLTGEEYKRIYRSDESLSDHETIAYSYDDAGRLTQKVRSDYAIDGEGTETLNYRDTITYSYDADGRVIEKVRVNDSDGNPLTANTIYTDTYVFGQYGLTSYEYNYEYASGGGYRYLYTYTYNDQGQITEKRRMRDTDNNGTADYFDIVVYTYDTQNRLTSIKDTEHSAVSEEPGAATDMDTTTFTYDTNGLLTEFMFEEADNGTDVDFRRIVSAVYAEDGGSATGTMETFSLDGISGEIVVDGDAESLTYSFAAGAPTATMQVALDEFPYSSYLAQDVETVSLSVNVPALYALSYAWQFVSAGPE